jgi:hypothetical protein
MEFRIIKTDDCLEIQFPMPVGQRILFLVLALFPCLAPYELIFRIHWDNYWNVFFLFAAVISAGALAVSGFFVWAAIAGLSTQMKFDKRRATFSYSAEAPVLPKRIQHYPLASIAELGIQTHEWSDGAPSYSFKVVLQDRRELSLNAAWSRAEVEAVRDQAAAFLNSSA